MLGPHLPPEEIQSLLQVCGKKMMRHNVHVRLPPIMAASASCIPWSTRTVRKQRCEMQLLLALEWKILINGRYKQSKSWLMLKGEKKRRERALADLIMSGPTLADGASIWWPHGQQKKRVEWTDTQPDRLNCAQLPTVPTKGLFRHVLLMNLPFI